MGKLQREEDLRVQWKVPGEAGWCECYDSASPIYVIVCWDQGEAVQWAAVTIGTVTKSQCTVKNIKR